MMLGLPVCRACRQPLGPQGSVKTALGWICAVCAYELDHPFYVVGVTPNVMLHDGPDGDEGIATWGGYLAGPFGTFNEAEQALAKCGAIDGERLAIYSTRDGVLSFLDEPL